MKQLSLLFAFIVLISFKVFSGNEEVHQLDIYVKANETFSFNSAIPFTSFMLTSDQKEVELDVKIKGVEYKIQGDLHNPSENGFKSQLIIEKGQLADIHISSKSDFEGKLILIFVPELNLSTKRFARTDSCEKPPGIDQDVWRDGLNPPSVSPTATLVSHCIVHHSAGSNSATDYTEVVRNIYVQHTSVNGWDDIGYNYLVAPDGTIFYGRDGMGLVDDDNVRGAHYCGKNTGTMGICLLGNFQFAVPQNNALSSLIDILSWKLNKESLGAYDSSNHPLPGGSYLGSISGHMDGCATDCPGTFLYAEIENVKDSVYNRMQNCNPVSGLSEKIDFELRIQNPIKNSMRLWSESDFKFEISDLQGSILTEGKIEKGLNEYELLHLSPGIYVIKYYNRNFSKVEKILKH